MLDPKVWESVDDHLPQDTNLRDVFGSMRDDAVTQLRKDSKILNLKDNISFWPLVKIPEDVSRYANIDEYGKCRVLLLRDLFTEISKDTRLSLVATLQKAEGKSRAIIQVPHKTKKGAFERVPDAERTLRNNWEDEYVYYRVGTKTLNDNDLSSSEQRVPQQHTIVAWYQKNEVEDEHRLQFSVIPSWNANDIELGNNDLGKLESNIPEGTIIYRRNGASASKSSIHKLLASKEDQDQTIIAALKAQVPQLSLHCFNPNDENTVGLDTFIWTDEYPTVTMNGPFIYYEGDRRARQQEIPAFFNIEIKEDTDREGICKLLDGEIVRKLRTKREIERKFKDEHRKFQYDLWVLPQRMGVRKLFRYKKGKLTHFMTEGGMRTKAEMYMEAHIIPMDVDE